MAARPPVSAARPRYILKVPLQHQHGAPLFGLPQHLPDHAFAQPAAGEDVPRLHRPVRLGALPVVHRHPAGADQLRRLGPGGGEAGGRVSVNHRECAKADRTVGEGDVLSCRGLGKCVVKEVLGQSKKGRFMLVLERYI